MRKACKPKLLMALCICIVIAALSTGCWDRREIEERGFVVAAAVDIVRPEEAGEAETKDRTEGDMRINLTFQYVVPGRLQGGGGGGGGAGDGNTTGTFTNISAEGETIFESARLMSTKTSRPPFIEHMKLLILSEEVAESGQLDSVLDVFLRDNESRRSVKVMVAKGEAKQILTVHPKLEKLPAIYINTISENNKKSALLLPETRIGNVQEYLLKKSSFTVQRIMMAGENEVSVKGAAVFDGQGRLAGYFEDEETEGLNFITDKIEGGVVRIKWKDKPIDYEIRDSKRSIQANAAHPERIEFTLSVQSKGIIAEAQTQPDFMSPQVIEEVERKVEEDIERMMMNTISKAQDELKKDVLGLGEYLRQQDHRLWKSIEDDWENGENYFAKSKIDVKANVTVESPGNVNRTEM
ncbi:Ger(x)C family spore germination protein [Paenibacillus alkalitolerans]|uniref:Ger(x)C family spore germination protein n=1 Tax=Paenibacillus alkalitolerans TaxID=2799335 RepID=UPI0018F7ACFE|nr:Ger(x)C family spore germination protein [Paenibacillus alkalitolerans]